MYLNVMFILVTNNSSKKKNRQAETLVLFVKSHHCFFLNYTNFGSIALDSSYFLYQMNYLWFVHDDRYFPFIGFFSHKEKEG